MPFWFLRVKKIWRFAGGWTQRYARWSAIGVKPPRLIKQGDRTLGERLFVEEIIQAIHVLARETSIFGEPAGVTPLAALQKAVSAKRIRDEERIVIVMSGNELKDIDAAMKSVGRPLTINPDMKELDRIVSLGTI